MCLMLKRMETSKVQIQIKNQIWSSCFVVLVMFTFCGHIVKHFDSNKRNSHEKITPACLVPLKEAYTIFYTIKFSGH